MQSHIVAILMLDINPVFIYTLESRLSDPNLQKYQLIMLRSERGFIEAPGVFSKARPIQKLTLSWNVDLRHLC